MRQMFASATMKLTIWYLMIIMAISLVFSAIIFEVSTNEVSNRLESLQLRLEGNANVILPGTFSLNDVRQRQTTEAEFSIFFGLLYINLAILGIGGIGGYLLARKTLQPIEAAHEAQSRFTSDASHELKTPLAVMKSEIEVALHDEKTSKSEMKELLESNLEEVDKLTNLSQALLQLSRLDYSDIPRNQRVDVLDAMHAAMQSHGNDGKRVVVAQAPKPIIIDGNQTMIRDLCNILIDNALQYSPARSHVQASITSNGRTCTLSVSNEGKGIAATDLPHIFDRFYRADRSRSSAITTKGYGLGLSLAKKIVDFHDGTITVQSNPGKLTTFTVSLPQIRKNR